MDYVLFDDFKNTKAGEDFMKENSSTGTLKVQTYIANAAITVTDTQIYVSKEIDNKQVLFFSGVTDSSGIIDNIVLPAPSEDYDMEKLQPPKYTVYDLVAENKQYNNFQHKDIFMYGGVKVLQSIRIEPQKSEG